ncbi:MAG TPA: hypothetical protein VN741_03860 [Mycobacterium sp.]|nr:hypothetical protein [Mycobacterium sp.]
MTSDRVRPATLRDLVTKTADPHDPRGVRRHAHRVDPHARLTALPANSLDS